MSCPNDAAFYLCRYLCSTKLTFRKLLLASKRFGQGCKSRSAS